MTTEHSPNESGDDLSDDLTQYLQMYVDETEEQLDDLVETMLVLEEDPTDEISLAAAFRLLHSMKGAAGMMGFDQITVLTHHLETRFERLRSGRIELDRVTMNLTLRCVDFLRQCNLRLRDGTELATPDVLLAELRELEERAEKELEADPSPRVDTEAATAEPPVANEAPEPEDEPEDNAEPEPETNVFHVVIEVAADATNPPPEVARVQIDRLEELGEIIATRPDRFDMTELTVGDSFDVILGTTSTPDEVLAIALAADIDPANTEHSNVQSAEVRIPRDPDSPPLASGQRAAEPALPDTTPEPETPTQQPPEPTTAHPPEQPTAPPPAPEPVAAQPEPVAKAAKTNPAPAKVNETMRVDIDRLDNLMSLAGELVVNRAQFVQVASDIGTGLKRSSGNHRSRDFLDVLARTIDQMKTAQTQSDQDSSSGQTIDWRTTIQELEDGLAQFEKQSAVWESSRRSFGQLDEAIDQLSRVSDSLQRGVLGTRMVPVGPLFNRFKRVVRDLSLDRGKDVALVLEGETTELDKRMIDAIGDPLTHLIRNSIDHGMESPDDRVAAGKPVEGTVTLTAQHRGNHVYIIIRDDGGGIDDTKIRARLVERNLLSAPQADAISREEAIDYIWHPGFSTAAAVTDVSGRGVGMDIVKSRIAELAGSIETESELGVGTTFTLKLPLTLAIISSLLVKIRSIVFAIPKDDVREIVLVPEKDIIHLHGKMTFEIRGQYVPLISLTELFRWNQPQNGQTESEREADERFQLDGMTEVAIVQSQGRTMGIAVDRSIGSQDVVIKSLADNFVGIDGLAGASILGNGSVALMLDVTALLKMAVSQSSNTDRDPAITDANPSLSDDPNADSRTGVS